jgi:LAO/AO transport system kinase
VSLAKRVQAGDLRAAARLLRFVDDHRPEALDEVAILYRQSVATRLIGMTGSPGAGKSTLIDSLITRFRNEEMKVGVIAVDPSSPITGGALLGDRIRMQNHVLDEGVFIRSLANRGQLGGLSGSVAASVTVMEAMGFDRVMVETVGVGQSEVDIARIAETTVIVLAPGLGDDIQALKAGSMEVADIFVVNKCDRAGAINTVRDIEQQIMLAGRDVDAWIPPVLQTNAMDGTGLAALISAMKDHRKYLEESQTLKTRREARARFEIEARLFRHLRSEILAKLGGTSGLDQAVADIADRKKDAQTLCHALFELDQTV